MSHYSDEVLEEDEDQLLDDDDEEEEEEDEEEEDEEEGEGKEIDAEEEEEEEEEDDDQDGVLDQQVLTDEEPHQPDADELDDEAILTSGDDEEGQEEEDDQVDLDRSDHRSSSSSCSDPQLILRSTDDVHPQLIRSNTTHQTSFSPSLDASFATSMSIGTAPPTPDPIHPSDPSCHLPQASTQANQREADHDEQLQSQPQSSSFLPAHLFHPNPNALPPSSPHPMDYSPLPLTTITNATTTIATSTQANLNPISPDPFRAATTTTSRQTSSSSLLHSQPLLWSASPSMTEARRTIGLRKQLSRSKILTEPIPILSERSININQVGSGKSSPIHLSTDGMEIDSPSYAQHRVIHHDFCSFNLTALQPERTSLQRPPRSARSGSQCSTGKRSRSLDEDLENMPCPVSSHPSSSPSHLHHRTRQPSSSPKLPLLQDRPKDQELRGPKPQWRRTATVAGAANLFAGPRSSRPLPAYTFSPPSSSPSQLISPSVKAAAKMTLGRKAGERSLSGFRFPVSKPGQTLSGSVRNTNYPQYGAGSLGAAFAKRPTLGVVQSTASLFSRHQLGGDRQRDAVGRPATKSRRAISFAGVEGGEMLADPAQDDAEEEEEDLSLLGVNCSPAPRTGARESHTWPKYGGGLGRPDCGGNARGVALQSPIRGLATTMSLGSTIESPVGMGFSEKERAGKILPCHKVSNDGLMRITAETMDRLMEGVYDEHIEARLVIDCRFGYEYEGGHILDAINVGEKEMIEEVLFGGRVPVPSESGKPNGRGSAKKTVLVFHCEYSAMRAPTMAKHLREKDRVKNMALYPALHYPEVYILEGGYARYYEHSRQWCLGGYVKMDDPEYREDRASDMNVFRSKKR